MSEALVEELVPLDASRAAPQLLVLEPSVLPEFALTLRGYDRAEVHAYLDEQRRRLAAMRIRAQLAEQAIAELGETMAALQHLRSTHLALPAPPHDASPEGAPPVDAPPADGPPADGPPADEEPTDEAPDEVAAARAASAHGGAPPHGGVPEREEDRSPAEAPGAPSAPALRAADPSPSLPVQQRPLPVQQRPLPVEQRPLPVEQRPLHARRGRMADGRSWGSLRRHRLVRYALCSAVSIALTEGLLAVAYGELRLTSAALCSLLASLVAAVPTFFLYRAFVWRIRGRSHLRNEVVPFGVVTAIGLGLSTLAVVLATALAPHAAFRGHLSRAAVVDGASVASFGVLWVLRFFVLDRFVFVGGRHLSRS